MGYSPLATAKYAADPSNYTPGRPQGGVNHITVHHMAGVLSAEQCGSIFQRPGRGGSAHYGIGNGGEIANYVDENDTAWSDSNWNSNCTTISIETSNCATGGNWPVGDAAFNSLIKLVADIAARNGLGHLVPGKNLCWHSMYAATTCPGDFLRSKMQEIADKANAINEPAPEPQPEPQPQPEPVVEFHVGDQVVPTRLVDYNGTPLYQWDPVYTITEINGDRAVLSAPRNGVMTVWAAMNTKDIRRA